MKISIKKYECIIHDGIAVICTIIHDDKVYDGMYWYDKEDRYVLTVVKELEDVISCKIEDYPGYNDLIEELQSKVAKYDDIIFNI